MRARIDVSEIESQTKIRAKYLRALENEEWDLLPGPTYVKSFLRTYAQALGLDARMLVDEYRAYYEHPSEHDQLPISPPSRRLRQPPPPRRLGPGWVIGGIVTLIVVALVAIGVASGGGGGSNKTLSTPAVTAVGAGGARSHHHHTVAPPRRVFASLRLVPNGTVYVCLETGSGHKLLDGVTLTAGQAQPVHRARKFLMTFGNGNLTMDVNGKLLTVPSSNVPLNYMVDATGRHSLATAQAPTCP